MYFHSSTQLLLHRYSPNLANSYVPESPPQDGTEYTYGQLFVCTNGSAVKIQTPTQWNPLGRNMTAQRPVASPSSILLPPSSYCAFIAARENLARISKYVTIYIFFNFLKIAGVWNCVNQRVYFLCDFWQQIHYVYLSRSTVAVLLEHREKCVCMRARVCVWECVCVCVCYITYKSTF